jgi:hypothetical protein
MKRSAVFGQFTTIVSFLAPLMAPIATNAASLPEDGKWIGTYACSEGVDAVAVLKPFSFPITFNVSGRIATSTTDNANFTEKAVLAFDGNGQITIELLGQRKADASKSWLIKARGRVAGDQAKAQGPMFRKDGTTLVRTNCTYDLTKQSLPITTSPAVIAVPAIPPKPQNNTTTEQATEQARLRKAADDTETSQKAAELEQQRLHAERAAAKQRADAAEQRMREQSQQIAAATDAQQVAEQARQLRVADDIEASRKTAELEQQKLRTELAAARQRADAAEQRMREQSQQIAAATDAQQAAEQTRQLKAADDTEASRKTAELEQQKLRTELAAAKQRADAAEQRMREQSQQIAAATDARQAAEQARLSQVASDAEQSRKATELAQQKLRAEAAAANLRADAAERRATELIQQLAAATAAPAKSPETAQQSSRQSASAPSARTSSSVQPRAPSPAPGSKTPAESGNVALSKPSTEITDTLLWRGTDDEQRLKQMIASLLTKDAANNPPTNDEQAAKSITEEGNLTLAVLNSLDALIVSIFLDKNDPEFKRDLSGRVTLGDGRMQTPILLLDSLTRIPRRSLMQSAALTLGLATDPAKASTDTREYQQLLGAMVAKLLKEKGIQPTPSLQDGTQQFNFEFIPIEWAEKRGQSLEMIGQRFPIIIAFDALINPAEGTDIALYRQNGTNAANARQRQAYEQRVAQVKGRLSAANFEVLGTPSIEDLVIMRSAQMKALKDERERLVQEMLALIARIDDAVAQKRELAGALRFYPKGKTLTAKPQTVFCTVTTEDALLVKGLSASSDFVTWSGIPRGTPFSKVFETADALYDAIKAQKCGIVIDNATNLKRYMAAVGRDGQFAFNVGPVVNQQEAQEPFAVSLGYKNWAEYDFSEAIGRRSPSEMQALGKFGVADLTTFKATVARMQQSQYSSDVADLLEFLADEVEGKKTGLSAKAYRAAENRRIEAETKEREAAATQQLAEQAKEYPYVAVMTCGMGVKHINILACFAAQNSHSTDTELKLNNGKKFGLYKAYNIRSVGSERSDGFYIDLREHFSLTAQNSHDTLILSLKVLERVSGRVLYENAGAKFDVLSVSN